jgi:hypothetical protein
MFALNRRGRSVALMREGLLPGGGTRFDAAATAVIADASGVLNNLLSIYVVDDRCVDVVHLTVIKKASAVPITAGITVADVAIAVVDASIEADLRVPVASIPEVNPVAPTPVSRSPQQSNLGRFHPRSGNPVIAAVFGVAPVARRPDITLARAYGLRVNRQHRWSNRDRQGNLSRGGRRHHGHHKQ